MGKRAAILLLLLLFQSTGYFVIFKIQRMRIRGEIKSQMKQGISEEQLVILKIPNSKQNELIQPWWMMDENEFRYYGKMYDVVRKWERGDTTWYYCLEDEKESLLFADLDERIRDQLNNSPINRSNQKNKQLFSSQYIGASQDELSIYFRQKAIEDLPYFFRIKTWIVNPATPPPQVLF